MSLHEANKSKWTPRSLCLAAPPAGKSSGGVAADFDSATVVVVGVLSVFRLFWLRKKDLFGGGGSGTAGGGFDGGADGTGGTDSATGATGGDGTNSAAGKFDGGRRMPYRRFRHNQWFTGI